MPTLDFARFLRRVGVKTCRVFVLVIGIAVLTLFYKGAAFADTNADAVYSFTKTMGDTDRDFGQSVAVDGSGNIYITGSFKGTDVDFDPGTGTDLQTSAGEEDIFLTKINSDGSYEFTKTMGGTDRDFGRSVAVDGSGNVYLTGSFRGTVDFDPGTGPGDEDLHTFEGLEDIFLTRINSDGSYGWTKTMGGTATDIGRSVAVDSIGNVYITGSFRGTVDFDPGTGPGDEDLHTFEGEEDIFLTRINSDGSYGWTKTMGGTASDIGRSVAVDSSGNVYITGHFTGTDADFNPDIAATDLHTSEGEEDIFLTKINADGSYGFTKTMGGTDQDFGRSVAVDSSDNVFITGYFTGTDADFDPGEETDLHTSAGLEDIFLTRINSDGSYEFTKTMGGTDRDFGQSVAVDISGNIYITGSFRGANVDFNPDSLAEDLRTSAGDEDIFLTKINFDGSYDLTRTMGGTASDIGRSIAVDSSDNVNVYLTGYFSDTVDFNPDTAVTDNHPSTGLEDIYLTKFRMVGFVVNPTSLTTTGGGDTATFTVRLLSKPSADVDLPVSSSNLTIGAVDPSSLTFTTVNWSVDQTVSVTSLDSSSRTYSVILGAASSEDTEYDGLNPTDVTVNNIGSDSGGSSCFIATAAYGSPLASHIKILRKFRDHFLLSSRIGTRFVRFYNTYSPPMADFIKKHDILRVMVRLGLIPFVGASWLVLKTGLAFTMVLVLLVGIGLLGFVKFIWSKKKLSR